jgi:periplasmic divalent cation tolerance protein
VAAPAAIIVTTSIDAEEAAHRLAEAVVTERLAACAQVAGPITSVYRWQGAVERATEWSCACKTTPETARALVARLRELHPYQVPEILVTTAVDGSADYLAWIREQVRSET